MHDLDEALRGRLRRSARRWSKTTRRTRRTRPASSSTACWCRTCSTRSAPTRRASARSSEIDAAMKAGAGHPMGPLTLADFVGLDTLGSIGDVHVRRVPRAPLRPAADPAQDGRGRLATARKSGHGLLRLLRRRAGADGPRASTLSRAWPRHIRHRVSASARRSSARSPAGPSATARSRRAGQAAACASASRGCSTGVVRRGGAARQLGRRTASAPTASSPAWRLVGGRPVALMANDPTVKAGSWGPKTVEKILRIQERALEHEVPMVYLVDSAGRPDHRPGPDVPRPPRRRADLPQRGARCRAGCRRSACCSGPRAAGGAYIPAFCDVVIMREGNASMYLGSPRMAEMVIGEKVTLEEMGGARDAHRRSRAAATSSSRRDEEAHRRSPRATSSYMPAQLARAAARPRRRPRRRRRRPHRRDRARRREQALRHAAS